MEQQIKDIANDLCDIPSMCTLETYTNCTTQNGSCKRCQKIARYLYAKNYRKQSEWINVSDRLPSADEYLTHHNDGVDTLKRILVAYQTDTLEYQIGCYDGYKWMNQLGNKIIKDVVAWKPFDTYMLPKTKTHKVEDMGE